MANVIKGNKAGLAAQFGAVTKSSISSLASIGVLQGLVLSSGTSLLSDGTFGRHMQVGALKNDTEGNPTFPSLQLDIPGFWRFRWVVKPGVRSIQINAKQAANGTPRPTMVVKANSAVGLAADLTGTAGSSTGWVVIGPLSFTCTVIGVVWVELHNNYYGQYNTPCYFDHRVAFG